MALDMAVVIDGRPLKERLKSDEGLVDYSKCEFGADVSNNPKYRIFDLG